MAFDIFSPLAAYFSIQDSTCAISSCWKMTHWSNMASGLTRPLAAGVFLYVLVQDGKSSYVCPHGPAKSPVLLNAGFVSFEYTNPSTVPCGQVVLTPSPLPVTVWAWEKCNVSISLQGRYRSCSFKAFITVFETKDPLFFFERYERTYLVDDASFVEIPVGLDAVRELEIACVAAGFRGGALRCA